MDKKKTKIILTIIIVAILAVCGLTTIKNFNNCVGTSSLEIVDERISYSLAGNDFTPQIVIKAKNNSGRTVKTSFSANIYYDGELFASVISNVLTLTSGDTGTFKATSAKFISLVYYKSDKWTYKITKWNTY